MKKNLLLCLFILFPLFLYAQDRVIDEVGLLNEGEKAELEKRIASIHSRYNFDLVILTVFDTGDKTPEAYADDYFDYGGYGVGSDADGALFLQVLNSRYLHADVKITAVQHLQKEGAVRIGPYAVAAVIKVIVGVCFGAFISRIKDREDHQVKIITAADGSNAFFQFRFFTFIKKTCFINHPVLGIKKKGKQDKQAK